MLRCCRWGIRMMARSKIRPSGLVSFLLVFAGSLSAQSNFVITSTSLPNATLQGGYNYQLQTVNGVGQVAWSASSSPPPGLSLSNGGQLSGTPTSEGNYSFGVFAQDSDDHSASANISISVVPCTPIVSPGTIP